MTGVEHPQQTVVPDQGIPGSAQYPAQPFAGTAVVAEPAGLNRFVPDADELSRRLAGVSDRPVRTRRRLRGDTGESSAGTPAGPRPIPVKQILVTALVVGLVGGLLILVVVLFTSGNLDFRGPQETSQSAPSTEPPETTPAEESVPSSTLPFLQAVSTGQLAGESRAPYPAVTSKDAMTALISAVAYENQPLMASLLHPEARPVEISEIVTAMNSPGTDMNVAAQTVACTESGETAACTAQGAGLTRSVQFIKSAEVWQVAGWA
ncbi:MAG: hypothetical protein IT198_16105 [Acidimicrobiia bacterium]|nr:hypothetical protein [Acidimicrobiia bacterium]